MGTGLDIRVSARSGGAHITVSGIVDEIADLSSLKDLEGRLEFDLAEVKRLNSTGVRKWVDVLRDLATRSSMVFVNCSPAIIDQLNMIHGFLASGRVKSFYGEMICDHCDAEGTHLFDADECRALDRLPAVKCDECGRQMELDASEDQFLLFLREPTRVHM